MSHFENAKMVQHNGRVPFPAVFLLNNKNSLGHRVLGGNIQCPEQMWLWGLGLTASLLPTLFSPLTLIYSVGGRRRGETGNRSCCTVQSVRQLANSSLTKPAWLGCSPGEDSVWENNKDDQDHDSARKETPRGRSYSVYVSDEYLFPFKSSSSNSCYVLPGS